MKKHTERALIVSGLWLHIGFIGAAALVAGLLQLFDGGPAWPLSLGLMLSGGVLAAAGWHRGWMVLEHTESGAGRLDRFVDRADLAQPIQASRTRRDRHAALSSRCDRMPEDRQ